MIQTPRLRAYSLCSGCAGVIVTSECLCAVCNDTSKSIPTDQLFDAQSGRSFSTTLSTERLKVTSHATRPISSTAERAFCL